MSNRRWLWCSTLLLAAACKDDPATPSGRLAISAVLQPQAATVGIPFDFDARQAFFDGKGKGLTFTTDNAPAIGWLSLANGHVTGTPPATTVATMRIRARDASGDTLSQLLTVVAFAPGLTNPVLPLAPFGYSDPRAPIPQQYLFGNAPGGAAIALSNMPPGNVTSDAGATLGRVLFYDKRLSVNDKVACASCHLQQFGFSDTAQFSTGFNGGKTGRHASALANGRFYQRGRFFWDERAQTLEDQALQPIQNSVEMGLTLEQLVLKLRATSYYGSLFETAFGPGGITSGRVSLALAQYVRSIISYGSRFDSSFTPGATMPNLARLTPQEAQGLNLFDGVGRCAQCHITNAQVADNVRNTGLDATVTDVGAGNGRFKSPSLRNVAVRGRFMHDGRFTSLEQVVDFYNSGIQDNPFLDQRLRDSTGAVRRFGFTVTQRDAIVAYLKTLTDARLMTDPRFSNPFP